MRSLVIAVAAISLVSWISAALSQELQHRKGPDGLEAWTVYEPAEGMESQGPLPMTLVIARNGKAIQRLNDGPFYWNIIFVPDGKRIAFTSGSLHFNLNCTLMDIGTSKTLATRDCYHRVPASAPVWVKALLDGRNALRPPDGL